MDRIERKKIKQDEFVSEGMRVFEWIEEHPTLLLAAAGAFVVLVLGGWGISAYLRSRESKAADLLARGQAALDAPVVSTSARSDDPYSPSFASTDERARVSVERLSSAADAGGRSSRVASYLEGVALLERGDATAAIGVLEQAVAELKDDDTARPLARAVLASAYAQAGQLEKALATWRELGEKGSGYPRDLALFGLARTCEAAGQADEARKAWREIVDSYPASPVRTEANEALSRL